MTLFEDYNKVNVKSVTGAVSEFKFRVETMNVWYTETRSNKLKHLRKKKGMFPFCY